MSPLGAKNLVNSEKEKRIEIYKSVLIGNKTLFVAIKWHCCRSYCKAIISILLHSKRKRFDPKKKFFLGGALENDPHSESELLNSNGAVCRNFLYDWQIPWKRSDSFFSSKQFLCRAFTIDSFFFHFFALPLTPPSKSVVSHHSKNLVKTLTYYKQSIQRNGKKILPSFSLLGPKTRKVWSPRRRTSLSP